MSQVALTINLLKHLQSQPKAYFVKQSSVEKIGGDPAVMPSALSHRHKMTGGELFVDTNYDTL